MCENLKLIEDEDKLKNAFSKFYNIIAKLRAPDGCPWDREQTPLSMRSDLVEETFEAVDAITQKDTEHTKEELGDVLLNAAMITYMHEQQNLFKMSDVLDDVSEKLVRRHPHVFPESAGKSEVTDSVKTSEQVLSQWDKIKQNLEGRAGKSILDEVPLGVPPLLRAAKMQKKAAKKGFEWTAVEEVYDKIEEELGEVKEAQTLQDGSEKAKLRLEEEIGDLIFSVVNISRFLKIDPVIALERANQKFYNRFTFIEQKMAENNLTMDFDHIQQMEAFWNEAKKS
ncbi:MAG: nucleoside triphosphate pyrophosphohydrolase [Spirochaetaceae bacterium]|nr:nucleoside triphosphate pyrophosphohydrolase [Spirochaetaceae bacterium]